MSRSDNSKSSRGGRGASLLEMMKMQVKKPGEEEAQPLSPQPTSIPPSGARGRASLLDLCMKRAVTPSTTARLPPAMAPTSHPPVAGISKGRASLLGLSQKIIPPGLTRQEHEGAVGMSMPSRDIVGVTSKLSALSTTQTTDSDPGTESVPISRKGDSGRQIQMTANYIRLKIEQGKGVFEYEVKYTPDIDSRQFRVKLLNQHLMALGGTKTFDGTILYLPHKLPQDRTLFRSDHPNDGTPVTITVIFKRQKRLGDVMQLFNVLFRRIMNSVQLVPIGRQHFNARAAVPVPLHKLELWPGYVTAIDEYEGGLQLCLDSTHRVLRNETVRDLMHELHQRNPGNFRAAATREIIGTTVLTRYNNKTYHIDDIYWDVTPLERFNTKDGDSMSYIDYYKSHWNINIRDKNQPLLLHRGKFRLTTGETTERVICLIPELCYLAGLTDSMRSDFRLMKDLATVTRVAPEARRDVIRRFIVEVKKNEIACNLLASWGLRIDDDILPLEGRVLEPEVIMFGNGQIHKGQPNADWGNAATCMPMLSTPNLKCWCLIFCNKDKRCADDFSTTLRKVGPSMGMDISAPRILPLNDDRTESFLKALRSNISPQVELMVIICPTNRNDRYAAIKKVCCVEMPIASQVIIAKTIGKPDKLKSVTQKIALQINCKLGGTLWALKIPFENCMVCGVDIHHAGPGGGGRGSVAAFVSSLDKLLTRWYSKVCLQGAHQEIVDALKICLVSALKAFYKENNRYPDRIIMYRDGVGDGQLEVVKNYEVAQLEQSFIAIDPLYKPKLSVIIVQKRINTKLFAKNNNRLENPPPGTIMDHTITRRNLYDFFLVSQHVRQGTVSPTHYIVVYDAANLKTDHMQRLTYKLCHLYYNWPGTVRVPAPCQYAHKLAFLVGQSVQIAPHTSLSTKLYFL